MNRILLTLLLIFSISVNAQDVTPLNKGDPAPYKGFLFSEKKAGEVKDELIEKDGAIAENKLLKRKVELSDLNETNYVKQNEIYEKQNDRLIDQLHKAKETSTFERIMWFGLGVLATGAAVSGARHLYK